MRLFVAWPLRTFHITAPILARANNSITVTATATVRVLDLAVAGSSVVFATIGMLLLRLPLVNTVLKSRNERHNFCLALPLEMNYSSCLFHIRLHIAWGFFPREAPLSYSFAVA